MEEKKDIPALFRKYTEGQLNAAELELWQQYVAEGKNPELLQKLIAAHYRNKSKTPAQLQKQANLLVNKAWAGIVQRTAPPRHQYLGYKWWYTAAACLMLLGFGLGYLQLSSSIAPQQQSKYGAEVLPAKGQTLLQLENGTSITLRPNDKGIVTQNGQIAYADGAAIEKAKSIQYVKVLTPKGGFYQVLLPDGTKVQLNAASTLRYPTRFNGNTREVELSGEAFFEVAHDTGKPFRVKSGAQQVLVTGTTFNINAYPEQPMLQTTLVSGSVKVQLPGSQEMLAPGQQARWQQGKLSVVPVDTEVYTAWLNNQFVFKGESLHEILLQLQRWYDLEIDLDKVPQKFFYGRISRSVPLSEVLEMLEESGQLHIHIEGRRLTIQ